MNDTTRRFLTAVVERAGAGGRIVELRLFPAIRQGGMESGVAVIAVEPAVAPLSTDDLGAAVDHESLAASEMDESDVYGVALTEGPLVTGALDEGDRNDGTPDEGAFGEGKHVDGTLGEGPSVEGTPGEGATVEASRDEGGRNAGADGPVDDTPVAAPILPPSALEHAPPSDLALAHDLVDTDVSTTDEEGTPGEAPDGSASFVPEAGTTAEMEIGAALDDEMTTITVQADAERGEGRVVTVAATPHARPHPVRVAILSARYRLVLKGPDRGKWEVDVTHEADAPIDTVARVARGVAKRAGEGSEPERYSGEDLRAALDAPAWITTR